MFDTTWSASEKKVARAAFERACQRESAAIRREVESMLQRSGDPTAIWEVATYLHQRRREIDEKYDFRYSVLLLVFMRLYREGWLSDEDLAGLRPTSSSEFG